MLLLFLGKNLVCCKTAWDDFNKIIDILGGPLEKQRTALLKEMIKVYPDDSGGEKCFNTFLHKKNLFNLIAATNLNGCIIFAFFLCLLLTGKVSYKITLKKIVSQIKLA